MALFGAERVLGGNFATEMALFGAERVPGGNFATEMALFGAELVLEVPGGCGGTGGAGHPMCGGRGAGSGFVCGGIFVNFASYDWFS